MSITIMSIIIEQVFYKEHTLYIAFLYKNNSICKPEN